jgi:hypothetical protein
MIKIILTGGLLLGSVFATNAQVVAIPDANFKNYLLSDPAINTNGDSEIQVSEAQAFTGYIGANALNIADLTGIEAFTSLTVLGCSGNPLGSIDVSSNVALTSLSCQSDQLTSLDLSNNPNLTSLNFNGNQLTSIDLTNNTALTFLDCSFNPLGSLDLSNCTSLEELYCGVTQLTTLDLSNNLMLQMVNVGSNFLTSLDLSNNTQLTALSCTNNGLQELNLANGNNTNMGMILATDNPNLDCFQVDNVGYSVANWNDGVYFDFDPQQTFDTDCFTTTTTGLSENGIAGNIQLYPNPTTDFFSLKGELSGLREISLVDLNGKRLKNWTNVNGFQKLVVSDLEQGIYIVQLVDSKGKIEMKSITIK